MEMREEARAAIIECSSNMVGFKFDIVADEKFSPTVCSSNMVGFKFEYAANYFLENISSVHPIWLDSNMKIKKEFTAVSLKCSSNMVGFK